MPLVILAGKEYGSGSSRDWAAKGPLLQGVRAVIAESYERIHRSNLVGMGILPLQFMPDERRRQPGADRPRDVRGQRDRRRSPARQELAVVAREPRTAARRASGRALRLDGEIDLTYIRNGGVLQTVLRRLAGR